MSGRGWFALPLGCSVALALAACSLAPRLDAAFYRGEARSHYGLTAQAWVIGQPGGQAACRIEALFRNPTNQASGFVTLAVRAFDGGGKLMSMDLLRAQALSPGASQIDQSAHTRLCEVPAARIARIELALY